MYFVRRLFSFIQFVHTFWFNIHEVFFGVVKKKQQNVEVLIIQRENYKKLRMKLVQVRLKYSKKNSIFAQEMFRNQ